MKTLEQKMEKIIKTVGSFPFAINSNPEAWIYEGEDSAGVDITVFEKKEDVIDAVNENWANMNAVEKADSCWIKDEQIEFE